MTVTFRKISHNDTPFMEKLLTNEQLMLMGWGKIFSKEEISLWITKILTGYQQDGFSYFLIEDSQQQSLGIAGLIKTEINQMPLVEIAYIIDEPYQGKGLASLVVKKLLAESFEHYNLNQVIIQCATTHLASIKIAEKNGATPWFCYERKRNNSSEKYLVFSVNQRN